MSAPSRPTTFNERFKFIDIRRLPNTLEFVATTLGRDLPFAINEIVGRALVSRDTYLPVGFAFVWFEPSGVCSVQAFYGQYFRQYPKDILVGMAPTVRQVREAGVAELHAIADETIEGSADLVRWLGGEKTGERSEEVPVGDVYRIAIDNPRMTQWVDRRG